MVKDKSTPGIEFEEFLITFEELTDSDQLEFIGSPKMTRDGWIYTVKFKGLLLNELKKRFSYDESNNPISR